MTKNDNIVEFSSRTKEGHSALKKRQEPPHFNYVRGVIDSVLQGPGMFIPYDISTIHSMCLKQHITLTLETTASCVDQLVQNEIYRKVFVGSEPHLILGDSNNTELISSFSSYKNNHTYTEESVVSSNATEEERFKLQIRVDTEHERVLLYRVLIMVETIALLIVLRELALWWMNI